MSSTLAKKLLQLRTAKGLTQREIAVRARMSSVQYSHYEQGRTPTPRGSVLVRLSYALEVSIDYLLGRTQKRTPQVVTSVKEEAAKPELTLETVVETPIPIQLPPRRA